MARYTVSMTTLKVRADGTIELPEEVRERYHISPEASLRVLEVGGGILLLPVESAGDEVLARELAEWQSLTADAWELSPYEEAEARAR
jgi:bifunctional DNA-binding transcriptional regulator/antitoxin component of YhaV-PrlF toxin-antitoxin module